MKGFVFRYGKILKLRQQKLDELRSRLLEAHQAIDKLDGIADQLQSELRHERGQQTGGLSIAHLLNVSRFVVQIESQLAALNEQREQLQEEARRRQAAAQDALREVKQMERLQEQQLAAYRDELARKEQESLDDFAVMHRAPSALPSTRK